MTLSCTAQAAAYQRDWTKSLRARLAAGEAYAFANADTPLEVFHALGMPVVVNQWWSSVIAAKQLSALHLDASERAGFHGRLAKYSALPLFAAQDGRPESQPWGGLPHPGLLCARASADDHPLIFAEWARLTGAPLRILSAPGHDAPAPDWWTPLRDPWEDEVGTARLDLMVAEIADLTALAETVAGRRTEDGALAALMARIDRQERLWRFVLQHEAQHTETVQLLLALLALTSLLTSSNWLVFIWAIDAGRPSPTDRNACRGSRGGRASSALTGARKARVAPG